MRSDESLVPKGDKKAMQRVMPFLQFVAAEVRTQQARRITHRTRAHRGAGAGQVKLRGEEAMALEMPFDEVAVLTENLGFMTSNLGVPEVIVLSTGQADSEIKEDVEAASKATPGKPTMVFAWDTQAK